MFRRFCLVKLSGCFGEILVPVGEPFVFIPSGQYLRLEMFYFGFTNYCNFVALK